MFRRYQAPVRWFVLIVIVVSGYTIVAMLHQAVTAPRTTDVPPVVHRQTRAPEGYVSPPLPSLSESPTAFVAEAYAAEPEGAIKPSADTSAITLQVHWGELAAMIVVLSAVYAMITKVIIGPQITDALTKFGVLADGRYAAKETTHEAIRRIDKDVSRIWTAVNKK